MHFHCGSRDGQKDVGHSILKVFFKYYSAYFPGILNCIVVWVLEHSWHFALQGEFSCHKHQLVFCVHDCNSTEIHFWSPWISVEWKGEATNSFQLSRDPLFWLCIMKYLINNCWCCCFSLFMHCGTSSPSISLSIIPPCISLWVFIVYKAHTSGLKWSCLPRPSYLYAIPLTMYFGRSTKAPLTFGNHHNGEI